MFDDRHVLFTSANIYDACFYSEGQTELGYYSQNNKSLCKQIKSAIPTNLLKKLDLNELMKFELEFPFSTLVPNILMIKTFLLKTNIYSPIHSPINFCTFANKDIYPIDNLDYKKLQTKPEWL